MENVEYVDVVTKATKETHDVALALRVICQEAAKAGKDGFQGGDISDVAMAAWKDLVEAGKNIQKIPLEATTAPVEMISGIVVEVPGIVKAFLPNQGQA